MFTTFLAVIHIIACLGLVSLVLIQDSKGGGVFTSQSSSSSVLGAGGATTLAQTMTKITAAIFAITCISLSIVASRAQKSVVDTAPMAAAMPVMPMPTGASVEATKAMPVESNAQAPTEKPNNK